MMENVNDAVSGSTDYMHLLGLVALGYIWTRMAKAAEAKIAAGQRSFHIEAKPVTARFFMNQILPETAFRLIRIRAGGADIMGMPAEAF
jgi:acyl-CoA dehydrogenase